MLEDCRFSVEVYFYSEKVKQKQWLQREKQEGKPNLLKEVWVELQACSFKLTRGSDRNWFYQATSIKKDVKQRLIIIP